MAKRIKRRAHSLYNSSSTAYDYDDSFYDDKEELRRRKAIRQAVRKAKIIKFKNLVYGAKFTISVLCVFAGCIVTMASNAAVDRQRVINNGLKDELIAIKSQNAVLTSKINDNTDLEYIEKEAKTRLNMTEPQPYQIVYIDVPKQSYTVQYEAEEEKNDDNFGLNSFFSVIKEIFEIL